MNYDERKIITSVTIGGAINFYEVYLYAYWLPILTKAYLVVSSHSLEFISTATVFLFVVISRQLGSLLLGYIGDRVGRKFALILSIGIISVFSLITALMEFSQTWGIYFILYIGIIKFIQGVLGGGEVPAAICLLSESLTSRRKIFLCSFALIGPQIGQILSMAQKYFIEAYSSYEFLIETGWRISFISASLLGFIGLCFSNSLQESKAINRTNEVLQNPTKEIFKHYKRTLLVAFFICIFEVASFFTLSFFMAEHFSKIFNILPSHSLLITMIYFIPILIIQPLIGKLGERYNNKPMYIFSALATILISCVLYYSIINAFHVLSLALMGLLIIVFCIQFALLPSLLASMFPSSIRFTGIGFTFNLCNSIVGGTVPLLSEWLVGTTNNIASFIIIFPISAIIFLVTFPFLKKNLFNKI